MNSVYERIRFKVICPLCGKNVILVMEFNDVYVGYCDNCERKIKLTNNPLNKIDGTVDIVLR